MRKGLNPNVGYNALCVLHCKQLAERLDPVVGALLMILEFDFNPR